MKTERSYSAQVLGIQACSQQSVSFVISADYRSERLNGLCSDLLAWIDQVGLQAEIVLVSRGEHPETWDSMKRFVQAEPERVRAIKCCYGQSARMALGHGERSSRCDLVLAMDSDQGVTLNDVRRVLSSFSARFQVIVGNLFSGRGALSKRFKERARGFFGRDSWDRVGIWGYRRSFLPNGLMHGGAYRVMFSPGSEIRNHCGEIDLQARESFAGLGLRASDLLDRRSFTSSETLLRILPSSGGGGFLLVASGFVALLWGASQQSGVLASGCEAAGALMVLIGIAACARRSLGGVIGEGRQMSAAGSTSSYQV